jgi:hypothetical protein
MADKKISQLTALSAANLAPSTDVLAIVDTSATETKKIVAQDLVNGVLNVASAVGIGTSSPTSGFKLDVIGDARFSDVAGDDGVEIGWSAGGSKGFVQAYDRNASAFRPLNLNNALDIDTSGNLGLGVTPSASSVKTFEITSAGNTLTGLGGGDIALMSNAYYNSGFKYAGSNFATSYRQQDGVHKWNIAPSWNGTGSDAISFTQAMTLDANGKLAIGSTNVYDSAMLSITTPSQLYSFIADGGTTSNKSRGGFYHPNANVFALNVDGASGVLAFTQNTTERARITSGGYFKANPSGTYIGSTSAYHEFSGDSASQYIFRLFNDGNNANRLGMVIQCGADNAAGTNYALVFDDGDGTRQGEITFSGGTTTYGTSSDYRLKENIQPIENALDRLAQLKPVKWNWKRNGLESEGFVAHELQEVVPIAVAGEKDAVNENGDPVYQSVGAANVVPLLTKALQEAMTRIEQLEAKVAALEAK